MSACRCQRGGKMIYIDRRSLAHHRPTIPMRGAAAAVRAASKFLPLSFWRHAQRRCEARRRGRQGAAYQCAQRANSRASPRSDRSASSPFTSAAERSRRDVPP